jgi:hypothetical protein
LSKKAKADSNGSHHVVFVSHSSNDTWIALQIGQYIIKAGAKVYLDEMHVQKSVELDSQLTALLKRCSELLVLFTPWSQGRPYLWMEIGAVWGRGKKVVAVLHGTTREQLMQQDGAPAILATMPAFDLNDVDCYFSELRARVMKRRKRRE